MPLSLPQPKLLVIPCILLLAAILLGTLKFTREFESMKLRDGSTSPKSDVPFESRSSSRLQTFNKSPHRASTEIANSDKTGKDLLNWISSERKRNQGQNYTTCLDREGNVSPERLIALGIAQRHIAEVTNSLNKLKGDIAIVVKQHIRLEDEDSNLYRVSAFKEDASPLFADTMRSISTILGAETSQRVMGAIPLEDFVGFMGAYDTLFKITYPDSKDTNINYTSRVEFTYYDDNGKPGLSGSEFLCDFNSKLLGALPPLPTEKLSLGEDLKK